MLLVAEMGLLSDIERLAGKQVKDPSLAALKASVQGNSPPDDTTNAHLLNDLAKRQS